MTKPEPAAVAAPPDRTLSGGDDRLTADAFLGGRLTIHQFAKGYRAGMDAALLAASVAEPCRPADDSFSVLDAGAGVGTAGLCVARRLPQARVTLVERDRAFLQLARRNINDNDLASRVDAAWHDILQGAGALATSNAAISLESFDRTIANPPFHVAGEGTAAPNARRASAHAMSRADLDAWCRFLAAMTRPGGTTTIILPANRLADLLASLTGRFGDIRILPVSAHAGEPAIRTLVDARKGSRAGLSLLSPFILHAPGGGFSDAAEAIFRDGAALAIA